MAGRVLPRIVIILACAALLQPCGLHAAPVAVRHVEGLIHGFLSLSTTDGKPLAHGDLTQLLRDGRVTTRLLFRFKDGSVHDETVIFSQRGNFHLLSYHLIQKGPVFQTPMDFSMDGSSVMVRYTEGDKEGDKEKEKVASERIKMPADVANGLIFTLLKNLRPGDVPTTLSMVAATPKPRLVQLAISAQGEDPFTIGDSKRTATHYVIKIEIGGLAGAIAPLLGKQPPDIHVWILEGDAPAFVRSEGPLFVGGPIWRIELASPVWPRTSSEVSGKPSQE